MEVDSGHTSHSFQDLLRNLRRRLVLCKDIRVIERIVCKDDEEISQKPQFCSTEGA